MFQQPRFKRGHRALLKTIKRKTSALANTQSGRAITPKLSNLIKDLSEMRHELAANTSRVMLMEKTLHTMAMRCEHLEGQLRTRRNLAPAPEMHGGGST